MGYDKIIKLNLKGQGLQISAGIPAGTYPTLPLFYFKEKVL
jgi:hypothetical protein